MATRIKGLGYTGECGYNQILYPTESQSKALLSWLVQKLPRSEEEITEESLGPNALLNKRKIVINTNVFTRLLTRFFNSQV